MVRYPGKAGNILIFLKFITSAKIFGYPTQASDTIQYYYYNLRDSFTTIISFHALKSPAMICSRA